MTTDELKAEYLDLIKYYQSIIYNYRNYPNYQSYECTWQEAERRLEYYTEEYAKVLNKK